MKTEQSKRRDEVKILGVRIDGHSFDSATKLLLQWAEGNTVHTVTTPNPEIILHANRDHAYRNLLNQSDLALPDGFGLRLVSKLKHTVTGADIATRLLRDLNHKRITLVIRRDGRSTAAQIQAAAEALAPSSTISIIASSQKWSREAGTELTVAVTHTDPDVVLVGLGFPHQEQWMLEHAQNIPTAKVLIAVGGTFDFWTGVATRAPASVRAAHMEWLWRLIREPRRILRIWNAVVIFPLTVLFGSRNR